MARSISTITDDIYEDWKKPHYAAVPYLEAMTRLEDKTSYYGLDDAKSIVLYFLSNAQSWKGPKAREIKAELKAIVK